MMVYRSNRLRCPAAVICAAILVQIVASGCSEEKPESPSEKYARHYGLGVEAYKASRYHEALRYFEKALEIEPENADLYLTVATIYEDCLDPSDVEEAVELKRRAIEYYEEFVEKTDDPAKKKRAREWLENCRKERMALEAGVPPENLKTQDAIEKEAAIEKLESSLIEIEKKYSLRLDKIHELESSVSDLNETIENLRVETGTQKTKSRAIPPLTWALLGLFAIVIMALAYGLRRTPATAQPANGPKTVMRKTIPDEKIVGSYVWVESVHNRGMMTIDREENGFHVQTRAINTSAASSGYGKYENNVLKAMLTDKSGEGALMSFEFFEEGRNFVASWEDELGHGSAVGLRNEFDEMVRPDTREKKADE
jgi:hypothetical protein